MKTENIYQKVTNEIITRLEAGVIPWRKGWSDCGSFPTNLSSKKEYHGTNWLLLSSSNYASPFWATFKQVKILGGSIKKGEHGSPIIYSDKMLVDRKTGKRATQNTPKELLQAIPYIKGYTVFNLIQCANVPQQKIPLLTPEDQRAPIEKAEDILKAYSLVGCPILYSDALNKNGKVSANYVTQRDSITVPKPALFASKEAYYATLFHEIIHSIGHPSRLNREKGKTFGSEKYGKEELVTEIGAAFLCARCGISAPTIENSAAYIHSWLQTIKKDTALIVRASSLARQAVEFIFPPKK